MYKNILETIGKTPLVEVTKFDTGACRLFLKLENQNPGGSIKDRIAVSMIRAAEEAGRLTPGGTIVEATAGNTGLGLALVGRMKGYKILLVIPDKMSQEKINLLKALGTEIIITRSDVGKGDPEYYQDMAARIAEETGAFYANQFGNPANPLAHELTTAPELWEQMEHKLDTIVVGVGSAGTMTGLTHFFRTVSPGLELVLADPAGSVLAEYVRTGRITQEAGSWLVEGIGEDFIPPIADFSMTKKAYVITDHESLEAARELLKREGILAGSSSGTLLAAALHYCREQTEAKRVVTFVCDSGSKYLSKMYNEYWLIDQGITKRKKYGDLRDIIGRRFEDHATVYAREEDTLNKAYALMKMHDVSQIPVLNDDRIIGIVDESDLLLALSSHAYRMTDPVGEIMTRDLKTLAPSDSIDALMKVLDVGLAAIIEDEDKVFQGLITKIDLINYLRSER